LIKFVINISYGDISALVEVLSRQTVLLPLKMVKDIQRAYMAAKGKTARGAVQDSLIRGAQLALEELELEAAGKRRYPTATGKSVLSAVTIDTFLTPAETQLTDEEKQWLGELLEIGKKGLTVGRESSSEPAGEVSPSGDQGERFEAVGREEDEAARLEKELREHGKTDGGTGGKHRKRGPGNKPKTGGGSGD
jgi:hypothetical protein